MPLYVSIDVVHAAAGSTLVPDGIWACFLNVITNQDLAPPCAAAVADKDSASSASSRSSGVNDIDTVALGESVLYILGLSGGSGGRSERRPQKLFLRYDCALLVSSKNLVFTTHCGVSVF